LSIWFVIPAGALIGGMGAASGYYAAAKWTQTMPSRRLLVDMVVIGGTSWLTYQWLDYYTLRLDDGTLVRDIVSFWQYFTIQAEHMQLTIAVHGRDAGTTGELGALGYVREGVQLLGFLAGGLATYGILKGSEVCEACRKYTKNTNLLSAVPAERLDQTLSESDISLPGVAEQAQRELGGRSLAGLDLVLSRCPQCGTEWLCPVLVVPSGRDYERIKLNKYRVQADQSQRVVAVAKQVVAQMKAEKAK